MIISRTPLRISFVGGGSDIAGFYRKSPGAVVTTAINKYIYIMVEKQFDGRIIVQYSKMEIVKRVSDIQNNLVREAMKMTGIKGGIHVTSISDVPAEGTGMGSSSAYVVGLLNAFYAYQGKTVSAEQLAREACEIEIELLKKPIGKQDQYIAAFGGFQYMQFHQNHTVSVDPIRCTEQTKMELESRLLLFYTGLTRSADAILTRQGKNMETQADTQNTLGSMVGLARRIRDDLNNDDLSAFGELLDANWQLKKTLADTITTPQIDEWYEIAKKQGAIGGKVLGAGGGGFLLLFAEPKFHEEFKKALGSLITLDFRFESNGSKIVFIG